MKPIIRNILAVVVGVVVGAVINGALISISGKVIPPPNGADVTTYEGLRASIHLFQPKHFVFPFLAHALGTLVGAFLTAMLAATRKTGLAMVVGGLFLVAGAINVAMLPAPLWFDVVDLAGAYIPMAWLGGRLGTWGARRG
ncbi:MAG: hypothetical protein ACOY3Y_06590 [Acidobacteriota bacterium]